jgi:hypothetical protein
MIKAVCPASAFDPSSLRLCGLPRLPSTRRCPVITSISFTNATKNLLPKVFAVAAKTPFPGHQPLRNFSCIGIIEAIVADGPSAHRHANVMWYSGKNRSVQSRHEESIVEKALKGKRPLYPFPPIFNRLRLS